MKSKPAKKKKAKRAVKPVEAVAEPQQPLVAAPVSQSVLVAPPVYAAPVATPAPVYAAPVMTAPPVYTATQQTVTYAAPQQTVVAQPMQQTVTYAAPSVQPTQAIQMATAAPVGMVPVQTAVTPTTAYFPG